MKDRCPAAEKVGTAHLADYRLVFNRLSKHRRCGVASIESAPGEEVNGVVFRLTPACVTALDRSEGYQLQRDERENSYNRRQVIVTLDGILTEVETYIAVPQEAAPLPNRAYLTLLRTGASEHQLPEIYRQWLDRLPAMPDPS